MRLLGVEPYLTAQGLNLTSLLIFAAVMTLAGVQTILIGLLADLIGSSRRMRRSVQQLGEQEKELSGKSAFLRTALEKEFSFTATQLGYIGSAFGYIYGACAILAGFVGDRVARRHLILGGCLFWSFVTITTGRIAVAGSARMTRQTS